MSFSDPEKIAAADAQTVADLRACRERAFELSQELATVLRDYASRRIADSMLAQRNRPSS